MTTFTPIQGHVSISGLSPTVSYANITGRGLQSSPIINGTEFYDGVIAGSAFDTVAAIFGGGIATGRSFSAIPTITVTTTFNGYVTGASVQTLPVISAAGVEIAQVSGRGFSCAPAIFGGGEITGRWAVTEPAITVVGSLAASVIGSGFATAPSINGYAVASITVTGGAFSSTLFYCNATGAAFASTPIISMEFTTAYAEAYVMNIRTHQVSRYQNYPFFHVTKINGQYYGINSAGLYLLAGGTDIDTPVNGSMWTMDMDYGSFHSKNTPYLYINGDDTYRVTAYVDSVEQPPFTSGFSGRRVKLARGNKGRYWSFKVEGVQKLQGIEFMPDELERRVK